MGTVILFGAEIDERCAEYLELVVKYARSGDSDLREVRRRALDNLGKLGCRKALFILIDKYAKSGDSDEREVRRRAFEHLEKIDGIVRN